MFQVLKEKSGSAEVSSFHPKSIAFTFYAVISRLRDFNSKDYHKDPSVLKHDKRILATYRKRTKSAKQLRRKLRPLKSLDRVSLDL